MAIKLKLVYPKGTGLRINRLSRVTDEWFVGLLQNSKLSLKLSLKPKQSNLARDLPVNSSLSIAVTLKTN